MLRSAGQQGSSSLAGRLLAENGSPELDQGRAATRIALRPHDPGTGEEIDKREIVKGYEYGRGQFVTLTPEELKALEVESSKVIDLETFVPRGDLDPVYFDSSYYLYPDGPIAVETLRVGSGDWFSPGIRFARDSPLEEGGFELPVPGRIYSAAMRSQVISRCSSLSPVRRGGGMRTMRSPSKRTPRT